MVDEIVKELETLRTDLKARVRVSSREDLPSIVTAHLEELETVISKIERIISDV